MSSHAFRSENVSGNDLQAFARRTLWLRLAAVADFLTLAAVNPPSDPEHVHQLRVATRRAAAAMRLFRKTLPRREAERMRRLLKQIRRAADAARDDDVLTARLRADPSVPGVLRLLKRGTAHRAQAQHPIGAIHRELVPGGRFHTLIEQLLSKLEDGPAVHQGDPAAWSRRQLRSLARKFRHAAERGGSDAETLHRFRIRTKKLRYGIELVAPLLPDSEIVRVKKRLERLQDLLGAINDHVTAEERFRRWLDASDDDEERDYLRANRKAERKAFRHCRRALRDWWTPRRRRSLEKRLRTLTRGG